jgi:Tfp pilus assembly protein PilE
MAGRKLAVNRVRASTLLEVVVSMVIIILVFGTAMMIYGNVMRLSLSARKIQAQALLKQAMQTTEKTGVADNESLAAGDLRIERKTKPFGVEKYLLEVDLIAYDVNGQQMAELHKVIISSHD